MFGRTTGVSVAGADSEVRRDLRAMIGIFLGFVLPDGPGCFWALRRTVVAIRRRSQDATRRDADSAHASRGAGRAAPERAWSG